MNSAHIYQRLWREVVPHWRVLVSAVVALALTAATEPLIPLILKQLLDRGFQSVGSAVVWLPLALVAIALVRAVSGYASALSLNWLATRLVANMRQQLFTRILGLPASRLDEESQGRLMSRFTYEANQVTLCTTEATMTVVRSSLSVIGLLVWMFFVNWRLTLLALMMAPAMVWVVRSTNKRLRKTSGSLQEAMGSLHASLDEVVGGWKTVKAYGTESYESSKFSKVNENVRRLRMKEVQVGQLAQPISYVLASVMLAVLVFLALGEAQASRATVGGFISFIAAMLMMISPIKSLTQVNTYVQQGLVAASSLYALMDENSEIDEGEHQSTTVQGDIVFEQVSFGYASDAEAAVSQVSFSVKRGEMVALVGPSGSGKSTLMQLLLRLYRPHQGHISLDGVPVERYALSNLRSHMAWVGQEVVLFNDTVAANIAYGDPEPDLERVRTAALQAHADEFITQLPEGYDSLLGAGGSLLSGGQRQRLAIARAFYRDCPILLLDEATSQLDNHSERLIQQAMEQLCQGRAVLVIAHRLSTVQKATRLVVLQAGQVVEIGSHEELLSRGGLYAALQQAALA